MSIFVLSASSSPIVAVLGAHAVPVMVAARGSTGRAARCRGRARMQKPSGLIVSVCLIFKRYDGLLIDRSKLCRSIAVTRSACCRERAPNAPSHAVAKRLPAARERLVAPVEVFVEHALRSKRVRVAAVHARVSVDRGEESNDGHVRLDLVLAAERGVLPGGERDRRDGWRQPQGFAQHGAEVRESSEMCGTDCTVAENIVYLSLRSAYAAGLLRR